MDSESPKEVSTPEAFSRRSRLIMSGVVLCLLLVVASGAWGALSRVTSASGHNWNMLFVWFSGAAILFLFGGLLWREYWLRIFGVLVLFLPSLVWVQGTAHAVILLLSALLSLWSLSLIADDLASRIRVSPYRSLHHTSTWFVVGLALAIASQYYVVSGRLDWTELVPKFDVTQGAGAWTVRMIGYFYAPARDLESRSTTVREFLTDIQKQELSQNPLFQEGTPFLDTPLLSQQDQQMLQTLLVARQEQELSRMVGREVGADEKMSQLLSEIFQKKTQSLIDDRQLIPGNIPLIPFILSVVLFLTVYPLGALLVPVWALGVSLLFALLRRLHGVVIEKRVREQERIV